MDKSSVVLSLMNRKYLLKSGIRRAKTARLIAKLIDMSIASAFSLFYYPLGLVLATTYMAIGDSLGLGQSFGKRVIGLAVISLEDGSRCSFKQSFIRNLPLTIPMGLAIIPIWGWVFSSILSLPLILVESYILFKLDSGRRLGDIMAETSVVLNKPDCVDDGNAEKWFDQERPVTVAPVNKK